MARELTSTQQANVEAGATRPIYLVEWQHSGVTEYLSCSGDVLYGDGSPNQTYTAGGITIAGLEDSKTATLILPATAARVTQIQNNTWRGGICKITAILALPGDSPVYAAADGLLVLDGVIESSSFSGESISVIAKSKYYTGALVPRFTYDDVVTSAPAVGTVSTWEGENYSYEQWLKTVAAIQRLVRPGVNPQVTGRPSVSQINSFEPIENPGQKLVTSQGQPIPIVYGRASVAGYVFAEGEYSGSKFVGVAWCMGRINSIESVFINDAPVPTTVKAKHYLGTTTQTVSPALQLYTGTSPQFSDDMVLRTAAGDIGIAYSVFNIPASAISGAPRFRAIIQGRLVPDPSSTTTDPYEDYVEWSFNFLTGTTDSGPNAYTLTLNGGASIASPSIGLELDGTGDYATIPDGTEIAGSPFTLEIELQCDTAVTSPGAVETILCKGSTASPLSRSIQIDRVGNEVLLYLSSDGSTWDIANGLSCGTLNTTGSPEVTGRILIERVDNQISTYMDGATQLGVVTSAALYNNGSAWEIGACGGSQELNGRVRSARLTIGQYRYGSPHSITSTPFSDSGDYQTGYVYSDNPALCWADLASDPVIGLGATTTGVQLAREYCDSPMTSGAPRCRIGLAITESRLVEAWLDQLAMYANALWFPEGANLKIIADRSKADGLNGSGPLLEFLGAVPGDDYYNDVSLLLHMDGADGSTTITDSGPGGVTVTATSGAQIDDAQSKFGGTSLYVNGTYDGIGFPGLFNPASGDWTIEWWYRSSGTPEPAARIFQTVVGDVVTSFSLIQTSTTQAQLYIDTNGTGGWDYTGSAFTILANTWQHWALVRNSGTVTLYLDGTSVTSTATVPFNSSASTWIFGGQPSGTSRSVIGHFDEIRATSGVARYTSSFTPPSAAFYNNLPIPAGITVSTVAGDQYSIYFRIDTPATTSPLVGVSIEFNGVTVIAEQTATGSYGVVVTAVGSTSTVEAIEGVGFDGAYTGPTIRRTHRLVDKWLPSTLSIQGTPEGDKPNAVEATYNIPSDTSGAWQQNTFPVINAAAAVGDPIVLTRLSLPGVNRIEEASNKAIATLYRNDNKTRVSLISTDEEFVAQPGDTIQVASSYRGVDTPVWVESNQMVSYGRHQITGLIYRDNQYPDKDYTTPRKFDEEGPPIEEIGYPNDLDPACYPWDCAAYEDWLEEQGLTLFEGSNKTAAKSWKILGETTDVPWPFSVDDGNDGKHILVTNFIAAPNDATSWGGTSPSSSPIAQDIFTETVSDKTFCTGTLSGMGSLSGDVAQLGYIAVTPAATRNGGPTSAIWGNHYMSALIMGHDIGTAGDTMSGTLARVSGKNWLVERNTGFSTLTYESDPGSMGVSISSSGSDVTITLFCNNANTNSAAHPTPVTFTVAGAATELHLVQTFISTGVITTGLGADGKYNTKREVTIRCNYAGSSGTLTCTQWYNLRTTPDYPIISLTPWYPAGSSNLWQQYFIDTVINIAAFSAGTVLDDFDFDAHTYAERMAWDRNNALYLPPGWCPAYSPP